MPQKLFNTLLLTSIFAHPCIDVTLGCAWKSQACSRCFDSPHVAVSNFNGLFLNSTGSCVTDGMFILSQSLQLTEGDRLQVFDREASVSDSDEHSCDVVGFLLTKLQNQSYKTISVSPRKARWLRLGKVDRFIIQPRDQVCKYTQSKQNFDCTPVNLSYGRLISVWITLRNACLTRLVLYQTHFLSQCLCKAWNFASCLRIFLHVFRTHEAHQSHMISEKVLWPFL